MTTISLITTCHRTYLLQYYPLYCLCCTLHPHDLCYNWMFILPNTLPVIPHPTPSLSSNHQFVLQIYEIVSVSFCLLIVFFRLHFAFFPDRRDTFYHLSVSISSLSSRSYSNPYTAMLLPFQVIY